MDDFDDAVLGAIPLDLESSGFRTSHQQNHNQIQYQQQRQKTNQSNNQQSYGNAQTGRDQGLIHISSLGRLDFQQIFGFQHFNKMQSASFADAFKSDRNMVLSAPTGAGKTGVMELAILRLFTVQGQANTKAIYISPTKALCDERQRDWAARFKPLNLTCSILTGDTDFTQIKFSQESNIIVTTPEKWDSVTRQFNDTHRLVNLVGLLLIDELHTIKDGVRGACLEAVITRMKSMKTSVRILAVSATVPNVEVFYPVPPPL